MRDVIRKKAEEHRYKRIGVYQLHRSELEEKPSAFQGHNLWLDRQHGGHSPGNWLFYRHNGAMSEHLSKLPRLIKLSPAPEGVPEIDHPKPERLIRGNPMRETWNLVTDDLSAGQVYCGVWRCEPGHWRIAMGPTERELFTVLSGRCRVHDDQGHFEEAAAGEGIYIPPGFQGAFEVLETLTKTYMICE